jgi:hypothetical protein
MKKCFLGLGLMNNLKPEAGRHWDDMQKSMPFKKALYTSAAELNLGFSVVKIAVP